MILRKLSVDGVIDCILAFLLIALLSCYYTSVRTVSRRLNLTPIEKLFIHFIETSPAPKLSGRQCCALESAARYNDDWEIVLWIRGEIKVEDLCGGLGGYISTRIYSPETLFANTPLIVWFARVEARAPGFRTHHMANHLGDALRLVILYIHGGVYMDLDILNLKSIDDLPRTAVAKEDASHLGNSFLAFPRGHPFLRKAMTEFASTYKALSWAHNGPRLLERVFVQWGCDFEASQQCSDITVLGHNTFFPVPYPDWKTLLDTDFNILNTTHPDIQHSHGIHLWNSVSQGIRAQNRSALHRLAQNHCPITSAGRLL